MLNLTTLSHILFSFKYTFYVVVISVRGNVPGNVPVNNDSRTDNGGAGSVQNTKGRKKSRDGARKRVHAQRDTIDKGPDRKVDGHAGTCNDKVFRFRVCGTGSHSYRFRVGTKRRRTRWQVDVRGDGKTWNGTREREDESDGGKKRVRGKECEDPRRDKPKSSTREGAIKEEGEGSPG